MNLLKIPTFEFDHPIVTLIVELEKLRNTALSGTTPHNIFFMLKRLFHLLESVGSARIEGNNTTIAEYLANDDSPTSNEDDSLLEIKNIDNLLSRIDEMGESLEVNHFIIRQFHSEIVRHLNREGSTSPGAYRMHNVKINKSNHIPPDYTAVYEHMENLINFINGEDKSQYDLIKIAIAHHAFAWIHPFDNGNGRVVRAFTYALMLKYGFKINLIGRVMNPVAVFCANRNKYYDKLQCADSLSNEGVLEWCYYVLSAVKSEYDKTIRLTDYNYVSNNLIKPSIKEYHKLGLISSDDVNIIESIIDKDSFKKSDVVKFFKNDKAATRKLSELRDKSIIEPLKENSKQYRFKLSNNVFLRIVASQLAKEGFLPENA